MPPKAVAPQIRKTFGASNSSIHWTCACSYQLCAPYSSGGRAPSTTASGCPRRRLPLQQHLMALPSKHPAKYAECHSPSIQFFRLFFSFQASFRHPVKWAAPDYYDPAALDKVPCRRCTCICATAQELPNIELLTGNAARV